MKCMLIWLLRLMKPVKCFGTLNPDFGKISKEDKIAKIQEELFLLDQKRIRAVCEPELKEAEEGQTWLEYYNFKILELRNQLAELQ